MAAPGPGEIGENMYHVSVCTGRGATEEDSSEDHAGLRRGTDDGERTVVGRATEWVGRGPQEDVASPLRAMIARQHYQLSWYPSLSWQT